MPRAARVIPPEGFLHVISRGNNRRKLFLRPSDFKVYLRQLRKLKYEESISVFHYCLMPTHIHLLVGIIQNSDLSRFMKRLNLKYFFHYQKRYGYLGHLWQDRFKSKLIEYDTYLVQCGKYIELNPVRANLVSSAADYPYSSYRYYALGFEDKLIDNDPLYLDLSTDAAQRRLIYQKMLLDEIACEEKLQKGIF
ncbi:MAG: hypothetical protein FJZ09_03505 [Candidatus Omnitrophica bacterium]|nr:hypothetical protein [Candidatus Omnitrophota bacterium]